MNGRCDTCERESLCSYPYKPTECCDMRKFELRPDAIECPECCGMGHESCYPILCNVCNGLGVVAPPSLNSTTADVAPFVHG